MGQLSDNTILIRRGTIIDPSSDLNRTVVDILIDQGRVSSISEKPLQSKTTQVIDATGCYIMPGLLDLRCQLKDPGFEHQEDVKTGAAAGASSGFTALAVHPTTDPVVQNKSQIEYLKQLSDKVLPDILPVGATTQDMQSQHITEMFDMRQAGAVGFSNGDNGYESSGTLTRALLYSKQIGGLLMSHALDADLAVGASVNESAVTIHTGLKQQPDLAETSQIKKEIDISEYADAPIHFSHISSAKSVDLIRKAKKAGLKVSCDVSIWHLIYTDKVIVEYDTNFKVTPPFRSESDRKALIKGVLDGTIDAIVSDHNPQNIENKQVEFDYADFGINGLQSFYSVYNDKLSSQIDLETFVQRVAFSPRNLLGLASNDISVGNKADFWVADPTLDWAYNKTSNLSRSENNPLFNTSLKGKCRFVVNGNNHNSY
ncbi:MAG: dihydroorotase [Bacteroidia bacterium]|jgi:dihydroorotase